MCGKISIFQCFIIFSGCGINTEDDVLFRKNDYNQTSVDYNDDTELCVGEE